MTEQMKKFLEAVSTDEALMTRLDEIGSLGKDEAASAFLAFAKERGYELTADDLKIEEGELEEINLDDVSGGAGYMQALGRSLPYVRELYRNVQYRN